ncbi:MAG TPA: tetratricopeptide repeat protein, partial [Thermodesulfobacteriota bacterium]|nr:tetratricopeptide repeat protein [Thermodesulfobacteriota bacterium]
ALPNLEEAPLFTVLGRKKGYEEGIGKTYPFTEAEKDCWANLFEYKGSLENVRLKFAVDKIGATLDDVVIVFEDSLNTEAWEKFISILKDGRKEETQPVEEPAEPPVPEPAVVQILPPPERKTSWVSKYRWVMLAGMIGIVVGIFTIWKVYLRPPPIEIASVNRMKYPLPDKPSIAVLPFVNMSGDPKQEFFCDGMTEEIITTLSKIPRLFVIARESMFVYKGKAVKVQKVAEDMGVRYVLEGSIQRTKDRMRIMVQLIDAIKGVHLWSERYDRDLKELFPLQDEIAMRIMTALQVKLTEGEFASAIAGNTSNLNALEFFWHAEEQFLRHEKEGNVLSRQWAEKAIGLDPNFAGAWAILGWTHAFDVHFGWGVSPTESMKRALECAQKAISLSDSCATAYALMAHISIDQRKFDEAIRYGEKGVRINPNDPHMLYVLAVMMHFNGRFDESIALIIKASRLGPYYPAMHLDMLSMSYFLTGRYEEALAAGQLLLGRAQKGEFSPYLAHMRLIEAYIGLKQDDKARAHAEEVLRINPNSALADERKRFESYRDPSHLESHVNALRKAGLR